jgi:hypothetical protein
MCLSSEEGNGFKDFISTEIRFITYRMACFGREIERGNRFLESPFVIGFEIVEYSCHVPAYTGNH